jgi:hypothetical protein
MLPIFYFEINREGNKLQEERKKVNCDIYNNLLTQCIYHKHSGILDIQSCYEQEKHFFQCIQKQTK